MNQLALRKTQSALIPPQGEWKQMMDMAGALVKSGVLPTTIRTPEAAVAIMLKGRELCIPPMQAFAKISIINGKPSMDGELMMALIYRDHPNAEIDILEQTDEGAKIRARRSKDREFREFSFDKKDAERAKLLGKMPWQQYPKAMYLWRAVSAMARVTFPESLMGVSYTPEELGADVNDEGVVINVPADTITPEQNQNSESKTAPENDNLYNDNYKNHRDTLETALKNRDVPKEQWPTIREQMKGKKMAELRPILAAILSPENRAGGPH